MMAKLKKIRMSSTQLKKLKELMVECIKKGSAYADVFKDNGNMWLVNRINEILADVDEQEEGLDNEDIIKMIEESEDLNELLIVWTYHNFRRGYYLNAQERKEVEYIR